MSAYQNRSWEAIPADEGTAEGEEGPVVIGAALIAHGEVTEAVEPGEGVLEDSAVATQTRA